MAAFQTSTASREPKTRSRQLKIWLEVLDGDLTLGVLSGPHFRGSLIASRCSDLCPSALFARLRKTISESRTTNCLSWAISRLQCSNSHFSSTVTGS